MTEEARRMIAIVSRDGRQMIGCQSIKTSTILAPGEGPKYALNGIDCISVFGEQSVLLGIYEGSEDIEKEIAGIREAVERGERTYRLQFCVQSL